MREIKFRGKRVDDGEWVYGGYWLNDTVTRQTPHIIDGDSYSSTVDHSSIGQYTGLKDKNGKEIYEGDILSDGKSLYDVKYSRYSTGIEACGRGKEGIWSLYHLVNRHNKEREIEVIGNIQDGTLMECYPTNGGLFLRKYEPEETGKPKNQFDKLTESPDALAAFLSLINYGKIDLDSLFCKSNCDDEECPHELQCIINWLNSPGREDKPHEH